MPDEHRKAKPSRPEPAASRPLARSLRNAELPDSVACPFCGSDDTEQFSAFGSAISTSQYYCIDCRTVFEFMKRRGR